jgi:hypothetical protein
VLILFAICLVVFFSVGIVLWAGTLGLQGYIYSEPATELYWRAPAAGAVLAIFLGLWCLLDYRSIDPVENDVPYDTIFRFSPIETRDLDQFISVKAGKEIVYKRKGDVFVNNNLPWQRGDTEGIVEEIVVEDKGEKLHFKPKNLREVPNPSDPDGPKLKDFPKGSEPFPGYYQVGGRWKMLYPGRMSRFRWGLFTVNVLLNVVHFGLWFVCLWLLLRFQWTHAFGLAVVFWLLATLVVVPGLLTRTRTLARERAGLAASSAVGFPDNSPGRPISARANLVG